MIMMWPPFGTQTEIVFTTQSCTASEVVHQEPHIQIRMESEFGNMYKSSQQWSVKYRRINP